MNTNGHEWCKNVKTSCVQESEGMGGSEQSQHLRALRNHGLRLKPCEVVKVPVPQAVFILYQSDQRLGREAAGARHRKHLCDWRFRTLKRRERRARLAADYHGVPLGKWRTRLMEGGISSRRWVTKRTVTELDWISDSMLWRMRSRCSESSAWQGSSRIRRAGCLTSARASNVMRCKPAESVYNGDSAELVRPKRDIQRRAASSWSGVGDSNKPIVS